MVPHILTLLMMHACVLQPEQAAEVEILAVGIRCRCLQSFSIGGFKWHAEHAVNYYRPWACRCRRVMRLCLFAIFSLIMIVGAFYHCS